MSENLRHSGMMVLMLMLMLMGSVHQMGKGSALRGNLCTYILGIYYILNA